MKESSDQAEHLICFREPRELHNVVFMPHLDDVFIEKRVARFCVLETVPETIFLIWRCQNKLNGPREMGNIVNGSLDEFGALGMARLHQ